MPITDLADRLGVNKETVTRLQKGDPSVGWGIVLEAAHLVGVDIFDDGYAILRRRVIDEARLLPDRVRKPRRTVNDDF